MIQGENEFESSNKHVNRI